MKKVMIISVIVLSLVFQTSCGILKSEKDIDIENISDNFLQGSITTKQTKLETEHFIINIDKNVYVPGYLLEYLEIMYDALEETSGLIFYNINYNYEKIVIDVNKNLTSQSEFQGAYANSKRPQINISSGDLLLGNSYAIAHELSHILQYSQSSWDYSGIYTEGFAEYNSYKTIKYLEEHNMYVAKANESSKSQIANMKMDGNIYSQTIQYWIENPTKTYDIAINGEYAVGMRFMNYLDEVYGNYKDWIFYYEAKDPYHTNPFRQQKLSINEQYSAMTQTYGENVFEGFYGWLQEKESVLYASPWSSKSNNYDLTSLDYTYIYPYFKDETIRTAITRFYKFDYDNLYVVIDEARNYLNNYKGIDTSNLRLKLSKRIKVKLYDSNDNLIRSEKGQVFSLEGVSYIKLVGKGTLGKNNKHGLEIVCD